MVRYIVLASCIISYINISEAKKEIQQQKQQIGIIHNLKHSISKTHKKLAHSARKKLYNKAFIFSILPTSKKREKMIEKLSDKTAIYLQLKIYENLMGNDSSVVKKIYELINNWTEEAIRRKIQFASDYEIEMFSAELIKDIFANMEFAEKQEWLINKLKNGRLDLYDAYNLASGIAPSHYEKSQVAQAIATGHINDLFADAQNRAKAQKQTPHAVISEFFNINLSKASLIDIREAVKAKTEDELNKFFEKIHIKPISKNAHKHKLRNKGHQ